MYSELLSPTQLGAIKLSSRVVMAPMTRSRAAAGDVAGDLVREYYTQRASAGLIITEGVQPSANGKGYCRTPGVYTQEQCAAWKEVADSVLAVGGDMVMQIMHCGRISSRYNKDEGSETVAPSAIKARGQMYTDSHGMVDFDTPRALATTEIQAVVDEYADAAKNAVDAGMAGVELHATSGYLPAQFLSTGSNKRGDRYGGTVLNRTRFVLEVLEAMVAAVGADRVAMRICPGNPFNDLVDANPAETFSVLLAEVNRLNLAYLHVIRMPEKITGVDNVALARDKFSGALILNDSFDAAEANHFISSGQADAVSFARSFIANPDLVEKFSQQRDLKPFDRATLYSPGAKGYIDYI